MVKGVRIFTVFTGALIGVTMLAGLMLSNTIVSANDSTVSDVSITVPVSCNITTTLNTAHTANIYNGTFAEDIGTTIFKTFCNDNTGYSIYAIGYSNDEYGNTEMIATPSTNPNITTGLATSGDTSAWSMKLIPTDGDYKPTIESDTNGSFANYHIVPEEYTKVATLTTNTDFTIGSEFKSTYRTYISSNQPAGTYQGKVKYTLVHPHDAKPPVDPRFIADLDTGQIVNRKLKRLAGNSSASYSTIDNNIVSLARSDTLPSDFTPTTENTISTTNSGKPIYAWYDSTNKTIYYYSEATTIKMNQDSGSFFYEMRALSDLSTISSWVTSKVTDMSRMFYRAGYSATTFTLDLSSWDTSSVTSMGIMFSYAGYSATTWSIGDLSPWNTSSVKYMFSMFSYAGYNATTWSVGDLSSWDTSNVTSMGSMFDHAGYSATTWSIGNLSSWNTSKVTNMDSMFSYAGRNATTFTLDLSSWDTSKVTNMSFMFQNAGLNATSWSVGDLSSWNTSSVTNMSAMFYAADYKATTFTLDLSSWDTSKVTNMSDMFSYAGYNATTFTLNLSSWDTSKVTNMSDMFSYAGYRATTWSVTIPKTNKGSTQITNTTTRLYGNTTSVSAGPPSGRAFMLADYP